jgi:hypothetical protein
MWLVLCDAADESALWVHQELRARGVAPLELLTADTLALADYWEHRIAGAQATIRFRIGDVEIAGEGVRGVLNRLYTVPTWHWRSASKADQEYVQQEMAAFFLSWLHALPCPVVNRPTPHGLAGRWRPESEWAWLAQKAGLPVAPYRETARDGIDETKGEKRLVHPRMPMQTLIVLGEAVAGAGAPAPVVAASRRLAELAGAELLGVDFVAGPAGPWTFAGATALPYLVPGGPALIDALCARIGVGSRPA